MGRFNINKIKGIDLAMDENGDMKDEFKLADVNAKKDMDIRFIERKNISKNENNFYNIGEIASLKQSIEDLGLKQPLEVVRTGEDKYKLIGGERRLTAIDELIAEGKWNKNIPCVITNFKDINLPLDDKDKEMYSLVTTNKEQRKRTDGEIAKEMVIIKDIYTKLKRQGVDSMIGSDGQEVSLNGKREREVLAETLGVSTGKIGEISKVEKQGSSRLIDSMLDDEIASKTAARVASLPKKEQDKMIKAIKKDKLKERPEEFVKITDRDVDKYLEKKKAAENIFSIGTWDALTLSISTMLKENDIEVAETDKASIEEHLEIIRLLIAKNM